MAHSTNHVIDIGPSDRIRPQDLAFEPTRRISILYHVWLLEKAGLMKVDDVTSHDASGPQAIL